MLKIPLKVEKLLVIESKVNLLNFKVMFLKMCRYESFDIMNISIIHRKLAKDIDKRTDQT